MKRPPAQKGKLRNANNEVAIAMGTLLYAFPFEQKGGAIWHDDEGYEYIVAGELTKTTHIPRPVLGKIAAVKHWVYPVTTNRPLPPEISSDDLLGLLFGGYIE